MSKIVIVTHEKPKFKKFGKLPGRPSELIRIALEDLKAAKKSGLEVNMNKWVDKRGDDDLVDAGRCSVCLAGAVMISKYPNKIKSLLKGPEQAAVPEDLVREESALLAINHLRTGNLWRAFEALEMQCPRHFEQCVQITEYDDNPKQFFKDMNELADALEAEGY